MAPPPVASDGSGADALEGFGPDVNHGNQWNSPKEGWKRMIPNKKPMAQFGLEEDGFFEKKQKRKEFGRGSSGDF